VDPSRLVFVTGFARGGTSWLRNCLAAHPDATLVPDELGLFRRFDTRDQVTRALRDYLAAHAELAASGGKLIEKSPANAPYLQRGARLLPEARFVFIVRDPRDVLVSHQRGNRPWMRGANSTVEGCARKLKRYYEGYALAAHLPNVTLVRYEDLHQDFHHTLRRLLEFVGLGASDPAVLREIGRKEHFAGGTGRAHVEDRDAAARKGVVGDWVAHLLPKEVRWFERSPFWRRFMSAHGYSGRSTTFRQVIEAARAAGLRSVPENTLLDASLDLEARHLLILHDVDLLDDRGPAWASVLETARIEAELGLHSVFNFLPLDDARYRKLPPEGVLELIGRVRGANPRAAIGLHFNPAERFFPPDAPEVDEDHPDVDRAIVYLHQQLDDYADRGLWFRTGTAHGYGRRKRRPNNRDCDRFVAELRGRGLEPFDRVLRPALIARCPHAAWLSDRGRVLRTYDLPPGGVPTDPESYRRLPPGSVVTLLTHPGNYPVDQPYPLGIPEISAKAFA